MSDMQEALPINRPEMKTVRDALDYLKHIEKSLRTAPRKQVNGGVLIIELLDDSVTGWCEFLREVIEAAEKME